MKYVFFVHSSITEIVSRSIITQKGLTESSCLFIVNRIKVRDSGNIKVFYLEPSFSLDNSFKVRLLFFKTWLNNYRFNEILMGEIGDVDMSYSYLSIHPAFFIFFLTVKNVKLSTT